MFTGIIEDIGRVKSVEKREAFGRIKIETSLDLNEVRTGGSISVNGVCLTVTVLSRGAFDADLSDETLRVTTLGTLKTGDKVNLERALTLSKPLGGHLVAGHVDGLGTVRSRTFRMDYMDLEVEVPAELMGQMVLKGSVAVDGISLTIAEVKQSGFRAAVIPQTLKETTLLLRREGSKVNIETDIIGKYVEKFFLAGGKKEITEDFLAEHGFFTKGRS